MVQLANKKRSERIYLKLQPYRQNAIVQRKSQKLAAKYFGPYQITEWIGAVAYKICLPTTATIHPLFQVSQLKWLVGNRRGQEDLPVESLEPTLQPQAILDWWVVKRRNQAATQVLVLWKGCPPSEATWEFTDELSLRFPGFAFEDNGVFEGGKLFQGDTRGEMVADIWKKKRTRSGFELKIVALVIGVSTLRFIYYLYASFY